MTSARQAASPSATDVPSQPLVESKGTRDEARAVHPKYRPDVDGLRAVAVLAVMGFHAFPTGVRGGFIGVDIFFVISGFLISTIIFANLERGTFSYAQFYSRRIRRIFPALLIVLTVCFVFSWFVLLADEFAQLSKHIAGGAGFLSNLLLWSESGYFDNSAQTKPLLHLWSLGIEEQFYVIWPLLLAFAWKKKWSLLTVTIAVGCASFALNVGQVLTNDVAAFYSPLTRFWELLLGGALAYATLNHPRFFTSQRALQANILSIAGALMIIAGLLWITRQGRFPGWWAVLPTVGTALIISASGKAWLNRTVLANPLLVGIGLISYPLYLWHWPLLSFARIIDGTTTHWTRLALLGVAFVLAWLTYQIAEKPIRFGRPTRAKVVTLVACALVLAVAGCITWQLDGVESRPGIQSSTFNAQVRKQFTGPFWHYDENQSCLDRFPFSEASSYPWWFCVLSKDENPSVILLGNSYANHLYPGLVSNPALRSRTILSIGVCPPEWVDSTELRDYSYSDPCSGSRQLHQMELIDDLIERTGTVRFAILDGLPKKPTARYIEAIRKRVEFLRTRAVKVIIFVPHVTPQYDTRECFTRPLRATARSCTVGVDRRNQLLRDFAPLIDEISRTEPDVVFFDQNAMLCDQTKCSFLRNGLPLFRDEYHHYSEYGSQQVTAVFVAWAKKHVPGMLE